MSKKKCRYCTGEKLKYVPMNNMGDNFILMPPEEKGEKWRLLSEHSRNQIALLKVRYCPMCGRKLKKGKIGKE